MKMKKKITELDLKTSISRYQVQKNPNHMDHSLRSSSVHGIL